MKLMNLGLNPGTNKNLVKVVRGLVLTGLIAGGVACNQCKKQEEASFNKANDTIENYNEIIENHNEIVKQQRELNEIMHKFYEYASYNEIVKQQGEINKILHKLYENGSVIDSIVEPLEDNKE